MSSPHVETLATLNAEIDRLGGAVTTMEDAFEAALQAVVARVRELAARVGADTPGFAAVNGRHPSFEVALATDPGPANHIASANPLFDAGTPTEHWRATNDPVVSR